jgi:hypothetical protein
MCCLSHFDKEKYPFSSAPVSFFPPVIFFRIFRMRQLCKRRPGAGAERGTINSGKVTNGFQAVPGRPEKSGKCLAVTAPKKRCCPD